MLLTPGAEERALSICDFPSFYPTIYHLSVSFEYMSGTIPFTHVTAVCPACINVFSLSSVHFVSLNTHLYKLSFFYDCGYIFATSDFQFGNYELSPTNEISDCQQESAWPLFFAYQISRLQTPLWPTSTFGDFKRISKWGRGLEIIHKVNTCITKETRKVF